MEILLHSELTDVKVKDGRIESVIVTGKGFHVELQADVFIDGTGDGDLGYMAGAECHKGQDDSCLLYTSRCV